MNARHLIAIIAVSVAGSAAAESTYPWVDFSGYQGSRTRAEVKAELAADGSGATRQTEFTEPARVASGKTRDEVRAELDRAHAEGHLGAVGSPEYVEFARAASTRSREEVRAEAIAARNAGARRENSGG